MDVQALLDLAMQHKWVAFSALLIGLIVRLLKSDTPLPTVPPKWRPWLALGLGVVSGVLDKMVSGTPWKPAILGGLLAAMAAIVGHEMIVESARSGRELFTPKPPSSPPPSQKSEKKLPDESSEGDVTPPVTKRLALSLLTLKTRFRLKLMAIAIFACLLSCKDPKTANEVKGIVLDIEQVACVLLQSGLGINEPAAVTTACNLAPVLTQDVVRLLAANQKAGAKLMALKAPAPAPVAPVPCVPAPVSSSPSVLSTPPAPVASAPPDAGSPPPHTAKKDGGK